MSVDSEANTGDRRPLASRDSSWARRLAGYLAGTSLTPNRISHASMGFAAVSCGAFVLSATQQQGHYVVCLLIAVLGCQLRLLCNLMDGMVAIEAGKQTPDGAVWNEFPDRVADILILTGVGVAAGEPVVGWVAATLAVLVAYVRELGKGIDGVVDFAGPMAKPHRMALVSAGTLAAIVSALLLDEKRDVPASILYATLLLLCAGSAFTALRRVRSIIRRLHR